MQVMQRASVRMKAGKTIISKPAAQEGALASNTLLEPIADDGSSDIEAHNGALLPLRVYLKLI